MSNWIPVEERLPEIGRAVWLYDGELIWVGCRDMVDSKHWLFGRSYGHYWRDENGWACDNEIDDQYQPTHWKTLPNPPKKHITEDSDERI